MIRRTVVFAMGPLAVVVLSTLWGCSPAPQTTPGSTSTTLPTGGANVTETPASTPIPAPMPAPAAPPSGGPIGEMHERLIGVWEAVPPEGAAGEKYRKELARVDTDLSRVADPEKRREMEAYREMLSGAWLRHTFTETLATTGTAGRRGSLTQRYKVVREGWERIEVD